MTSRFASLYALGVPLMLDQVGTPGVYLPAIGTSKPVRLIEQSRSVQTIETDDGLLQVHTLTVILPRAQVLDPQRNATIRLGTEEWAIDAILAQSETMSDLALVRRMPAELAREGYRGTQR